MSINGNDKAKIMFMRETNKLNLGNVIRRYFTFIKVKRNHSIKSAFFFVNVPEVKQYGFGFTVYLKGTVYGFSVHNNGL